LVLNGITRLIVISLVSLPKFLEDPYYVYAHGYFIRPIYHSS